MKTYRKVKEWRWVLQINAMDINGLNQSTFYYENKNKALDSLVRRTKDNERSCSLKYKKIKVYIEETK